MDDVVSLAVDSAARLFDARFPLHTASAREPEWRSAQWEPVCEMGLPIALADSELGGLGMDAGHAVPLLQLLGRYAVRLPLAETMLANLMLSRVGLEPVGSIATLSADAVDMVRHSNGYRIKGCLRRVPWARDADFVVVRSGNYIALVPLIGAALVQGGNLASEPRDSLSIDAVIGGENVAKASPAMSILAAGAAMRTIQLAGAIDRILEMTLRHAGEREQFGRPLAKFQVIQHDIARLAEESAAASTAAQMAGEYLAERTSLLGLAAAKSRAAEAAAIAAKVAHQIHGAMGFTQEHSLHCLTRSVLAWREEFGGQSHWSRSAGKLVIQGPARLWPLVTEA